MKTLEDLEKLYADNPYPEDMVIFCDFVENHKTQLILLREQARVNGYKRLYGAVQQIFELYGTVVKDRGLYKYPSLKVHGEYDAYLLHTLVEAATPVMEHYGRLFKESRGVKFPDGSFSSGNYRWGDACSFCSRLLGDIKCIWGEDHYG